MEQGLAKGAAVGRVPGVGHHGGGHPDERLGQTSAVTGRCARPLQVDERAGVGVPGALSLFRAHGHGESIGGRELQAAPSRGDEAGAKGFGEFPRAEGLLV